jgi:hypothetical protein
MMRRRIWQAATLLTAIAGQPLLMSSVHGSVLTFSFAGTVNFNIYTSLQADQSGSLQGMPYTGSFAVDTTGLLPTAHQPFIVNSFSLVFPQSQNPAPLVLQGTASLSMFNGSLNGNPEKAISVGVIQLLDTTSGHTYPLNLQIDAPGTFPSFTLAQVPSIIPADSSSNITIGFVTPSRDQIAGLSIDSVTLVPEPSTNVICVSAMVVLIVGAAGHARIRNRTLALAG